jgi:hypothetical protein
MAKWSQSKTSYLIINASHIAVQVTSNATQHVPLDSTIGIAHAGGILAARVITVDTLLNYTASSALIVFDGPKGSQAARFVHYLYQVSDYRPEFR